MGGKHATTTSTVSVPPEVLARYNAVNTRAETAASQPFKAFGNTASDYVAQMNAQQNAGISDINATAGSYQPYMTQATTATQAGMGPAYEGIDKYMSPYTKNVADTTGAMMRQQQEQAQSGALGTAAMSGAFGGDRAGIAAANLQQQNQMGYGKTMADIMNQGYTQALGASQADLARQLQGGAQMASLGAQSQQLGLQGAQAKIAAGTMQQQTEQAGKDAMINRFMQEQGLPTSRRSSSPTSPWARARCPARPHPRGRHATGWASKTVAASTAMRAVVVWLARWSSASPASAVWVTSQRQTFLSAR